MTLLRSLKNKLLRVEIWLGLAVARLLIKFVPFRYWRSAIGAVGIGNDTPLAQLPANQAQQASNIGRVIKRVARRQRFRAVCLPQAMTGRWVLARRGIPTQIVFGSRPDPDTGYALHAWLKAGDAIVTGEDEYEAFQSFEARAS